MSMKVVIHVWAHGSKKRLEWMLTLPLVLQLFKHCKETEQQKEENNIKINLLPWGNHLDTVGPL